ncbi:MAG: phosphatidylcholine/phosphatidylserine synthase, partial [Rhodospirillales bacterium]|nr:phosphatidylcholine/phosphatidylserine synthase [Rhodospirillales bacterium]
ALQERWEHAVLAIVVAAVLDGLDGRIARILKGATRFGAELDSLSDFLCFGASPAIILYVWTLQDIGRIGWSVVLLFCICCALRLARFNTDMDAPEPPAWRRNYFVGMPTPAGAGLALLPMVLWFQTDADFFRNAGFVSICVMSAGILEVSRVRTFSFKKIRIEHGQVLVVMLAVGLYFALLFSAPWATLSLTMIAYLVSIPFSVHRYRTLSQESDDDPPAADAK